MEPKNKDEYLNKRVIITGASSGVGKCCAHFFLNAGAKVVLCGRDLETMKSIGKKYPDQAAAIVVDLSNDLQLYDFKSSVIEILGGIDIMINCAGIMFDGDVEKTFPQDYDYIVDVNLRSIFALIMQFSNYMAKNSSIVNVSCLYGSKPQCGLTSYCMSKAGLEMLTKFAAAEFSNMDVRVNGVASSAIDSNLFRSVGVNEKEFMELKTRLGNNIPLGKVARPDDVAKQIIFLCSNRASRITGQILKVDGGRSLTLSGYTHWKGSKNMAGRFEPVGASNSNKMSDVFKSVGGFFKKGSENKYPMTEEEIDRMMTETNWSTRLSEAHEKVTASYKSIDRNDAFLQSNYVNKK